MTDAPVEPAPTAAGPRSLAKRILAFAGIPFVALLSPFIVLPVLARVADEDVWLAIAIGQSVGAFAALGIALGYSTVGPAEVAGADAAGRRRLLAASIHARLPLWVVGCAIAVLIAALVAPASARPEAMLMAAAMSLTGLTTTWYMIGVGRALPLLTYDVLPRFVATLIAGGVLIAGGSVLWYPGLLAIAIIGGTLAYLSRTAGRDLLRFEAGEVRAVYRRNATAVAAEASAGAYNALAVTLVGIVAPVAQAARYVSGDKLYRIGQYAVTALGNALQGWVVEPGTGRALWGRIRVTILLHAGLGILGFAAFVLLGPWLTAFAFGPGLAIDTATAAGFGAAAFAISLGTAFGRVSLIALGRRREFMVCVMIASATGVVAILVLGSVAGAAGAAWGLAIGELVSVTGQGLVLLAARRAARREGDPGSSASSQ